MNEEDLVKKHKNILSTIQNEINNNKLYVNDFELEIIDSCDMRLSGETPLSWKQFKIINRVYERIE